MLRRVTRKCDLSKTGRTRVRIVARREGQSEACSILKCTSRNIKIKKRKEKAEEKKKRKF